MAVKRLTIELDDIPDTERPTTSPSTLLPKEQTLPVRQSRTDIPTRQEDYQESELGFAAETNAKEVIGRTPADLVYVFMNRAEFMATILFFFAFLVSIAKLQTLTDLWIPFSIGLTLNTVWFGVLGIKKIRKKNKKIIGLMGR